MSADEIRVEAVARRKSQKFPLERHWRGEELVAATCRVDGTLHHVEELLGDRGKPGGHRLLCRTHDAEKSTTYRATPRGAERSKAARRRAVESGRNAERMRRRYAADPEGSAQAASDARKRYAARTPEEILADQRRLRPDGLKKCIGCREWFPLGAFTGDATKADGLQAKCRTCRGTFLDLAMPSIERRDTWICTYCGNAPAEHGDHVHPRALGGVDAVENLIGACATCNTSKHDRDLFDWRPDLFELVKDWPVVVRLVAA